MKNFIREAGDIRYWFFAADKPRRCYSAQVFGWAMKTQMGGGGLIATGEGFPVLIEENGALKPYLTPGDLLGISFGAKDAERIVTAARARFEREETERLAALSAQKRAEDEAKAADASAMREATEAAERSAQAIRDKKAVLLADADTLIYGD
ncbi:hypothetical protein [Streptomyces sp. NBC_00158]|uniref:hypothetical protein n=1 Tax=Streptomyces sp. NBC_00158 TaxID=2903627 RepID=UPI003253B700